MMADEKLMIDIELTGAAEAIAGLDDLKSSTNEAGVAAQHAGPKIDALGDANEGLSGQVRAAAQAQEAARRATQETARAATESTQRMIALTQKFQGASAAVATLAGQLGQQGGTVGLIASLAGAAAQGANLGMVFGPGGALVGGILGSAVPALIALKDAMHETRQSAEEMVSSIRSGMQSLDEVLQRQAAADAVASRRTRLLNGGGTIDEYRALVEQQSRGLSDARSRLATAEAQNQRERDREQREREMNGDQNGRRMGGSRAAELVDTTRVQAEVDMLAANLRQAQQELAGATTRGLMEDAGTAAEARRPNEFIRRPRGGGGRRGGGGGGGRSQAPDDSARLAIMEHNASLEFVNDPRAPDMLNVTDFEKARQDREDQKNHTREMMELDRERADKLREFREEEDRHLETQRREEFARINAISQEIVGQASNIGGVFMDAFEQAEKGQAKLDDALQNGFKELLKQQGQKYIFEGVAALAEAIGYATTMQPQSAAGKAAEGGIKLGLGVAMGAAGFAIPAAGAAKPESPMPEKDKGGDSKGGGTVVVNLNAPTVMSGTTQQVGRDLQRSIRESESRFGRAA
jgi:hypothetical protein